MTGPSRLRDRRGGGEDPVVAQSPIGHEREYRATLAEGPAAQIVSTRRGD
ncbi:hypothetical protein [Streptomyces sp. MUSC 14]|nr:hypothetical protein [Streptomyces sp. MUSC 14]